MRQPPKRPGTEDIRAGFDAAAQDYGSSGTFFTQIATRLIEQAKLAPGDQVLDAGCGTGLVTIAAARTVGPGGRVSGLDLSEQMLKRAGANCMALGLHNVTLTHGDAHEPPYAHSTFDAVLASMLVFLLADPQRAVRAWYQLLCPGGTLAFSWNATEDPRWQPVIAAVDAHLPAGSGFAALLHHPPFDSVEEIETTLATANFTGISTAVDTIDSCYTGPRHWWAASWSQAPRIAWQHIPENVRGIARDEAFRLLAEIRNADGTLTRHSRIAFTVARRPEPGSRNPEFTPRRGLAV